MMHPCPKCRVDWRKTELLGEASHGGGYKVKCNSCGHIWDDPDASHHERETARKMDMEADRQARAYGFEVGRGHPMTPVILKLSDDNPFLSPNWKKELVKE